MKLFLTSAGIVPEVTKDFIELLNKDPKSARLVFVPNAADHEPDKLYVEEDKKRLASLGFDFKTVDLKNENQISLDEKFNNADIVFVEGGNTFYLLDLVKKSGFDKSVKKFLERGGVYVGVSAGSIIAGPNIEPAGWKYADKNIVGLNDLAAMGLVSFAIAPHIDNSNIEEVKREAAKVCYPVIALADEQAVLVDGNRVEIIGGGDKIVFKRPLKSYFPQIIKEIGFDFDWDEKKVWKFVLPVIEMDINELIWHFEVPFYSGDGNKYYVKPREVIDNPVDHKNEYEKMKGADLRYPLDLMENKGRLLLLDGLHRLMKAYIQGEKTVKVRIVPRGRIPEIL